MASIYNPRSFQQLDVLFIVQRPFYPKRSTGNHHNNNNNNNNNNNHNYNRSGSYQYRVSENIKNVEIKRLNYQNLERNSLLQRSCSADNVVIRTRGFKPSDRHDPCKRHFLEHLTSKILHFNMDSGEKTPAPINLEKLLRPAMDCTELLQTKKKMYASSCFYAPTHPTVEDQVELARRISYSLSDAKNMKSKGQSMYVNRKKRSVKWIHDGNGSEPEEEPQTPMHKDKVPLKCVMNPNGKVMDINCIQALGEEPNIGTSPINADKLFDIVRDLNNHKGRGAEIFAKRRKRSEKWVVDRDQPSTPTQNCPKTPPYPCKMDYGANENSNFANLSPLTPINLSSSNDSKPFFNPFTMDLSLDNGSSPSANKMFESTYNGPNPSTLPSLANYNTAPRGWDQSQAVYRPVTFRKQEPIAYSDF